MTSFREFARLINEANGTKLDNKGAKRRLENIGATAEDLNDPKNLEELLQMCSENPPIWKMYAIMRERANGIDPVENERIKQLEFQNAELRKALSAFSNLIGDQTCK